MQSYILLKRNKSKIKKLLCQKKTLYLQIIKENKWQPVSHVPRRSVPGPVFYSGYVGFKSDSRVIWSKSLNLKNRRRKQPSRLSAAPKSGWPHPTARAPQICKGPQHNPPTQEVLQDTHGPQQAEVTSCDTLMSLWVLWQMLIILIYSISQPCPRLLDDKKPFLDQLFF